MPTATNTRRKHRVVVHEALTTEEMRRLALTDAVGDKRSSVYARDRMLIDLMVSTGLRSCEAVSLTRIRCDLEVGRIFVAAEHAKSGVGRPVWLGPTIRSRLAVYLDTLPPRQELLFATVSGQAITTGQLRHLFKKIARRTGIQSERLHPHALRHTYAIRYLERGGSLMALRDQLGHADIETTSIYLRSASRVQAEEATRLDL
jgi:site-specific recombinase XerD